MTLLFLSHSLTHNVTKGPLEYSDLMEYPMLDRYYANHNMLTPTIEMLAHRHKPKFLLLAVRDLPQNLQPIVYSFPIIVCDISPFKTYPEEFLCLSGDNVRVWQMVLQAGDPRSVRDDKIRALHKQCTVDLIDHSSFRQDGVRASQQNVTQINKIYQEGQRCNGQYMLFYLTEMWPGGTSKQCPQADTHLLRTLFADTPLLGGRGKHFIANEIIQQGADSSTSGPPSVGVLQRLYIPTVITVVRFS